jgi:hypothetical protein
MGESEATRSDEERPPRERIIDQIQQLSDDGDPPTAQEFDEAEGTLSRFVVREIFGKWNNAVEAAGFTPRMTGRPEKYSRTELIEQIQQLATDGNPPTYREFRRSEKTASKTPVIEEFGWWNDALEAAGFEPNRYGVDDVSRGDIIALIRHLASGDEPPGTAEFNEASGPSTTIVYQFFDDWDSAKQAAGF